MLGEQYVKNTSSSLCDLVHDVGNMCTTLGSTDGVDKGDLQVTSICKERSLSLLIEQPNSTGLDSGPLRSMSEAAAALSKLLCASLSCLVQSPFQCLDKVGYMGSPDQQPLAHLLELAISG